MRVWSQFCVVVLLGLMTAQGFAQQQTPLVAPEPTVEAEAEEGAPAQTTAQPSDDETTRILVIGDSIAGGLGNGIARMAEGDSSLAFVNRFNEASGLARTELYDWSSAFTKIIVANPIDAVLVHVGINDRQDIRASGTKLAFRSPEWETAYTANVDRLIAEVKRANARLYWVSLPPIRDARLDADIQYIAAIHRARVEAGGGRYIDVRGFFLDSNGKFLERGPDDTGAIRKLRARDGIAFMRVGNNRFGQLVLAALKKEEEALPLMPAVATTPQVPVAATVFIGPPAPPAATAVAAVQTPTSAVVATSVLPELGQVGLDGQVITFRPDISLAPVPELPKPVASAAVQTQAVVEAGPVAKPGSQSARLFKEGVPLTAPAGRFDDYAEPPPPPE